MENFSNIDPYNCSIEELKAEIERLEELTGFYESKQLALKTFINSVYGSLASKYCVFNNVDVAESITLQGQNLNHFTENCINRYFEGFFQGDTELHVKLGITTESANKVNISNGKITKTPACEGKDFDYLIGNETLAIAGDTDSLYIEFGRITRQLNISNEDSTDFILKLWNDGLEPYLNNCFELYAQKFNCPKNLEVLELEKISNTTILISKKHYAMEECWKEPNIYLEHLEEVLYKGLEQIQGSTPKYAKECQDDFYRYLFDWFNNNSTLPKYEDLIAKIKGYKEKIYLQDPEDICKSMAIGDYNKFILEDKQRLTIGMHCPIHVKAAGIANHILYSKPKYRVKYSLIKKADKVKFYYAKDKNYDVFGFLPSNFPMEYALKIDYDKQFNSLILDPLNRAIEAIGYQPISDNLIWCSALW